MADPRLAALAAKDFGDELERMWHRIIVDRLPTAFARFGDGEGLLIRGSEVHEQTVVFKHDGWSAPSGVSQLGIDLLTVLQRSVPEFFIGLSDVALYPGEMVWELGHCRQDTEFLTYACLFINSNYPRFRELLVDLPEETIVLAAHDAALPGLAELRAREFVPLPRDCVRYWEENRGEMISRVQTLARSYDDSLFLLAGGPMANVLVDYMWIANPTNRYIDVGSALDEVLFRRSTRDYQSKPTLRSTFDLRVLYANRRP